MLANVPLGPKVTLTASARTSTPFRMLARPSFENLMSLCAPRASTGCFALTAARRRARDEVAETRCIVVVVKRTKLFEDDGDDENDDDGDVGNDDKAVNHSVPRLSEFLNTVSRVTRHAHVGCRSRSHFPNIPARCRGHVLSTPSSAFYICQIFACLTRVRVMSERGQNEGVVTKMLIIVTVIGVRDGPVSAPHLLT